MIKKGVRATMLRVTSSTKIVNFRERKNLEKKWDHCALQWTAVLYLQASNVPHYIFKGPLSLKKFMSRAELIQFVAQRRTS